VVAVDASKQQQTVLLLCAAAPAVIYATLVSLQINVRIVDYALIACGFVAVLGFLSRIYKASWLQRSVLIAVGSLASATAAWCVARGTPDLGVVVILAALFLAVAQCYWYHYNRISAGVMTAVGGFVLWGVVFPAGALLDKFAPRVAVEVEVWNIPKYLVAVGMILTLLEDQVRTSDFFVYHDELTGVPNRRLLEDRLEQSLAIARRAGSKVAVLQLDLDRFKEVNDTYGHPVGDRVLREVVARLSSCIHLGDTLARSGGDEFTIVSDVEDKKAADEIAASLAVALSVPILIDGNDIQTGLSIGIALYPDDGADADQLHSAADRAMYAAKRAAHHTLPFETSPAIQSIAD